MGNIQGLTPEQKAEGLSYCWKYKDTQSHRLLRNFMVFGIEEEYGSKYYLIGNEVMHVDYTTSSKESVSKKVFAFVGHGKYIGSEDKNGSLDKDLLKFYKNNPDKIPAYHQQLFEILTAPKHRE